MEVESWKSDDNEENREEKKDSNETPQRVVVDQVFENTKEFDKILNDKGAHYLETNTVVYPNFVCTDKTIFPNQVFVTTGNAEKIHPEFNKMIEKDNLKSTIEGFFANQNTEENNLTQNSYVFQKQKSLQKWVVKGEKPNKIFEKVEKSKAEVKLNSHEFKLMVGNYSTENNVLKRKQEKQFSGKLCQMTNQEMKKNKFQKQNHLNFRAIINKQILLIKVHMFANMTTIENLRIRKNLQIIKSFKMLENSRKLHQV